jgi:flagellar hook-associated protein 3 FlgL
MTLSNVSTSYLNTALLPAVRSAQTQLATLEVESSTGEYADLGQQLGAQSGYEMSLRTQDDLLQSMTTANGITATNLSTTQSVLTTLQSSATSTASSLLSWSAASGSVTLQSYGQGQLQQLLSLGNSSAASGYLFAGQNTATPPFSDYNSTPASAAKTALDAAFQNYFNFPITSTAQVANISASDMQTFLAGPFAQQFKGQNWTNNWSSASSVNSSAEIAPGDSVETNTNANTAGFQLLAQGYSMLSEFGGIGLSADAQQAVANTAIGVITQGAAAITTQAAGVGVVQSDITQADDNMSGQMQILQTQLNRSDSVDQATIATELTTLTNQLQAAYQLTAKITSMNLAQYLPS